VTHAKLRRLQSLLSHSIPTGDVAQVLDRALDALIAQVEKRKFAATSAPRKPAPAAVSTNPADITVPTDPSIGSGLAPADIESPAAPETIARGHQ